MITDRDYSTLADNVYEVDKNKAKHPIHKGDTIDVEGNNKNVVSNYQVLEVKDNVENGMQAMAVAPIKNGKPDTSQVVIAFAGTNADDGLDILTDTQTVGLNKDNLDISTKLNFNGYNK